jgi:regulator of protease activity HflC (stomatin/prohibitin superfamily)
MITKNKKRMKMKNFKLILALILFVGLFSACTTVDSGHRGVVVKFGKVEKEILPEGFHFVNVFADVVEYDIREKTLTEKFEFNDKNNMPVPVKISIDYSLIAGNVNTIQSTIGKDQLDIKIITTLSSAAKQVIPQYSATELNLNKREEAEQKIFAVLKAEFPEFFVNCSRVRITDVDLPGPIAQTAVQNATQTEKNNLAEKKVIEAKNNLEAARFDAETKAILSQPQMLRLKEIEVEMEYAKRGVSRYGANNVFGSETAIVKGLR